MTPLRILGETAYPATVASARVRIANFAPYLAPHGIALAHRPALTAGDYALLQSSAAPARKAATLAWSGARAALRRRPEHELLLVHRLRLMAPLPGYDPPGELDVYDLDDALFLGSSAAVNRLFDRCPNLRIEPERWEADDVHIHGERFRSPTTLPVIFDVA